MKNKILFTNKNKSRIYQLDNDLGKSIHILITKKCNNHCFFCFSDIAQEKYRSVYQIKKELISGREKIKDKICYKCKFFKKCEGVWKEYVNIFGFDEFKPYL